MYIKVERKIYNATIPDDDSDEESELNQTNSVMEFTTHIKDILNTKLPIDNELISGEDGLSDDVLVESYKILYFK